MRKPNPERYVPALVSLMRDAGDDGSHAHQPGRRFAGQPNGKVVAGGKTVDTWSLDPPPCTHRGCRCLLRWLPVPKGRGYAWLAVATTKR